MRRLRSEQASHADCGLKLERIGQRKAKGSGTERGAPDAFLYVAGFAHPLEFKRPKPAVGRAGRCSLEQMAAAERRRACGVETFVVDSLQGFTALVNWGRTGRGARPAVVPGL